MIMANSNPIKTVAVDKDHLSCCICFNLLKVPKLLSCFHTICKQCLQQYIEQQADAALQRRGFDCPMCKQFTTIPNPVAGWADQLATDFRIQAMTGDSPDADDQHGLMEDTVCAEVSDTSAKEINLTLVNTIHTKIKEDKVNPIIVDVLLLSQTVREITQDVILVCDTNNRCLKAFWFDQLKDKQIHCRLAVDEKKPDSVGRIAKINETQIALAAAKSTKIYIINVNNGLSIHTTIDTGHLNNGIGVIWPNNQSVPEMRLVTGHAGGLSIIDMDGTVVKPMDIDFYGKKYTTCPWFLTVNSAGNILVSDHGNCLLCITQTREVLWKYQTGDPAGMKCDAEGNIYLAVSAENKVVLLSPDGVFVKEVLSSDDTIQMPRSVYYVSRKERLYLVEMETGFIKIFQYKHI